MLPGTVMPERCFPPSEQTIVSPGYGCSVVQEFSHWNGADWEELELAYRICEV